MKRKVKDEDGYEEGDEVADIVHRHSLEQSTHDDDSNDDASQGKIISSNGIMTSRQVKIENNSIINKTTHISDTTTTIGQLQSHLSKMVPDKGRIKCPYLDTVNRQMIDFDSEKLCSITLTNMNVYVCLVCGKYFQGRGKTTPLFTHSVQAGHFVFMNLQSGRVYSLPDDYEVIDTSLRDVQRCLSPRYSLEEINALNRNTSLARDVHSVSYLPGFVGLNNLNSTDYINSLLHALAHVTPFRDYWLEPINYELCKSNIVHRFGLTLRKLWSSSNFKSTVSPQELVQEVVVESNKRFIIGQRAECIELMVWMLNTLQRGVLAAAANKKRPIEASPIYEPFQGIVEVTSLTKKLVDSYDKQQLQETGGTAANNSSSSSSSSSSSEWVRAVNQTTFSHLSLDIPACPLFRDSEGGLVIPQVPLFEVLRKFDGHTWSDQVTSEAHVRRQYRILQLPRYLILHLVRFTRNNFYLEKNPTIVTFPVKNLEMRDFLFSAEESTTTTTSTTTPENDDNVSHIPMSMSIGAMKQREIEKMITACPEVTALPDLSSDQLIATIKKLGSALHKLQLKSIVSTPASVVEHHRNELLIIAQSVVERVHLFRNTKYDLLANICHDSTSSAKMVTVGDLNLLLGHSTATKQAKNASLAMANGSISSNNNSNNNGPEALGQSAAATSSNNRVLNDGAYKVHIQHKATGQWFEVQDLRVTEVTPQFIGVSESNILIYEKKSFLK